MLAVDPARISSRIAVSIFIMRAGVVDWATLESVAPLVSVANALPGEGLQLDRPAAGRVPSAQSVPCGSGC
jgi:hypothetical protein